MRVVESSALVVHPIVIDEARLSNTGELARADD